MTRNQTVSMMLMLTAASGLAFAAPEKKQTTDKDLLRGPAVVDSSTPADADKPGMMKQTEQETELQEAVQDQSPMAVREMVAAIKILSSERSGNQLNLSPEQDAQVKVVLERFRTEMQAFQQDNMEKIREMRSKINAEAKEQRQAMREERQAAIEAGKEPPQRPQPQASETAKELREMIENSPPSQNAIAGIKRVLSDEQLELVKKGVMKSRLRSQNARQNRQGQDGEAGMERESNRREVNPDRVRPEQRRQRNQKNKSDTSNDD